MDVIEVSFRRAEEKDIATMVDLWWGLHEYNSKFDKNYYAITSKEDALKYKRRYYGEIMNNENFFISVVESEEKKVVGYIIGEIIDRDPFYQANRLGKIHETGVDPNYQQKGLFMKAYLGFINFLKEKGIDLINADMDVENAAVAAYWKVNFYKRAFKIIAWIKETEKFMHRVEKKKKLKREKVQKGLNSE